MHVLGRDHHDEEVGDIIAGHPRLVEELIPLALEHPDRHVRWQFAVILRPALGHLAVAPLRRFVQEDDGYVRDRASAALAWLGVDGFELPVRVVDGSRIDDFAGFCREFSALLNDYTWRGNLDAFNDILYGGFGTPEDHWILRWTDSDRSRVALGHAETARRLEGVLRVWHPTNTAVFKKRLKAARRGSGPTLFDDLVTIIRRHAPDESGPGIGIRLELG